MSSDSFSPDPTADTYPERLDVSLDADKKTIRRATKYASSKYHPDSKNPLASEDNYYLIKQAAQTLKDRTAKKEYQEFYQMLGGIEGTKAFETWEQKGRPQTPNSWIISEYDGQEIAKHQLQYFGDENYDQKDTDSDELNSDSETFNSTGDLQWEEDDTKDDDTEDDLEGEYNNPTPSGHKKLTRGESVRDIPIIEDSETGEIRIPKDEARNLNDALENPKVVWGDTDTISTNYWTVGPKPRLYVNSLLEEDFYIDLHTGQIETENGNIPNISISFATGYDAVFISDGEQVIKIATDYGPNSRNTRSTRNTRNTRNTRSKRTSSGKTLRDRIEEEKRKSRKLREYQKRGSDVRYEDLEDLEDIEDLEDQGKSEGKNRSGRRNSSGNNRTDKQNRGRSNSQSERRDWNNTNGTNWTPTGEQGEIEIDDQKLKDRSTNLRKHRDRYQRQKSGGFFTGLLEEYKQAQDEDLGFSLRSIFGLSRFKNLGYMLVNNFLAYSYALGHLMPKSIILRIIFFFGWLFLFPDPTGELGLRSMILMLIVIPFPTFAPYALGWVAFITYSSSAYPPEYPIFAVVAFVLSLPFVFLRRVASARLD